MSNVRGASGTSLEMVGDSKRFDSLLYIAILIQLSCRVFKSTF